jgi:hypothetical protein
VIRRLTRDAGQLRLQRVEDVPAEVVLDVDGEEHRAPLAAGGELLDQLVLLDR